MKKSKFITEVFLGLYGDDSDLYNYSLYYRNNLEIMSLLYDQSKEYLKNDIYLYIRSSDVVKNHKDIKKYVIDIDSKFQHYAND